MWYVTNAALLAFVFVLLHRLLQRFAPFRRCHGPAPWVFWALTIAMSSRHIQSVFENQSNDLLVFAIVMACVYGLCLQHEKLSGFAAGVGAACKATPLLFLPVFAWQRRYAAVLATKGVLGREVGNEVLARGSVALCALVALCASVCILTRSLEDPEPVPDS